MDRACVPFEGVDLLSHVYVPQPHRLVRARAGHAFAVRAEAHAVDLSCVPPESALAEVVEAMVQMPVFPAAQVCSRRRQQIDRTYGVARFPLSEGLVNLPGVQ